NCISAYMDPCNLCPEVIESWTELQADLQQLASQYCTTACFQQPISLACPVPACVQPTCVQPVQFVQPTCAQPVQFAPPTSPAPAPVVEPTCPSPGPVIYKYPLNERLLRSRESLRTKPSRGRRRPPYPDAKYFVRPPESRRIRNTGNGDGTGRKNNADWPVPSGSVFSAGLRTS